MNTIDKIRIEAIRVIDNVVRLQWNVNNGCFGDAAELDKQKARLDGIKKWANDNGQMQNIMYYFGQKGSDFTFKFLYNDLMKFFAN